MELQKQHNDTSDKCGYFLLAVTGAAIGFGLQKLDGLSQVGRRLYVSPRRYVGN